MANMLPRCDKDQEIDQTIIGSGTTGEKVLYRVLKKSLPDDWWVIWNRRLANETSNHQYDFLILVPNYGVMILDAKGHGYCYNEKGVLGCKVGSRFIPHPDMFDRIQDAKNDLINGLNAEFASFGACNCLVAFIDSFGNGGPSSNALDWVDCIEERVKREKDFLKDKIIKGAGSAEVTVK